MDVPPKTDPRWKKLLVAPSVPNFTVLATKLTVGRLRLEVKQRPAAIPTAIDEVSGFFAKNSFAKCDIPLI